MPYNINHFYVVFVYAVKFLIKERKLLISWKKEIELNLFTKLMPNNCYTKIYLQPT